MRRWARAVAWPRGGNRAEGRRRPIPGALCVLLLLVLVLASVEYLLGSILYASPLRTNLYQPIYNATLPTIRSSKKFQATLYQILPTAAEQTQSIKMKQNITVNTTTPILNKNIKEVKRAARTDSFDINKIDTDKPLCYELPQNLEPVPVNKTEMELDLVERQFPEVQIGGMYTPPNCTARHKVAIIIPFRDRRQHLAIFLNHMHQFLQKQQIEYGIFIVEQESTREFNRAKLMNVGFKESQKLGRWQCFIFHDVDLLPLDLRNMYSCPRQPRHMSASVDNIGFKLPYEGIFGGVSAMTLEQFTKVNGFSNNYWGWGGEDDDMYHRLTKVGYHIGRYSSSIARYAMLDHKRSAPSPKRYQLLSQTSKMFQKDGLSTLEYQVVEVTQNHLHTRILVNIDDRNSRETSIILYTLTTNGRLEQ